MTHEEKAEELFRSGMNCSQSVFCAFSAAASGGCAKCAAR